MNGYVNPDREVVAAPEGASRVPSPPTSSGPLVPTTASLLRAAFPGRGRPKVAGREFDVHPDTVRHWAAGRFVPSADRLLALAARCRPLRRELLRVLQELEEADGG